MHILEAKSLSKHFGGIRAIEDVSFRIQTNSITSIIGPNGAGKTTLFNCLTGITGLTGGTIKLKDDVISGLAAHKISKKGIARTFQNIRLFSSMTASENVMVAQHTHIRYSLLQAILRNRRFRSREAAIKDKAYEYLELAGIADFSSTRAGSLSYGNQRRLEIARALATEPDIILLDEPTAGMNPAETKEVMELISKIKQLGKTLILIEHDMHLVMGISDHIIVLDHGVKIAEGSTSQVKADPLVIEAYLGSEAID